MLSAMCRLLVLLNISEANNMDLDQTAPLILILVHTICMYAKINP